MKYINPDEHFGSPRVWSPERNRAAWELCYCEIAGALKAVPPPANFYIVCSVQGAGKSFWIAKNPAFFKEPCIVLDAALPQAKDRERALRLGRDCAARLIGVWVKAPLDIALARNSMRQPDTRIPEETIRYVQSRFEAPDVAEGFDRVVVVDAATTNVASAGQAEY